MAIKYLNKVGGNSISNAYNISVAAPFDVRSIVDTYSDLTTKGVLTYASMYEGMMVTVADTSEVYILKTKPSSRDNATAYATNIKWVKVGGDSASSAKNTIVSSFDNLTDDSVDSLSIGSMVYVNNTDDDSNNGLYILVGDDATDSTNWIRLGGDADTKVSINDTQSVLKDYVSSTNLIKTNTFYSSLGLNTYENGDTISDVEYITLSNGGNSTITLYDGSDGNWISMHIEDDSLGFTLDSVKIKNADGTISDYANDAAIKNDAEVCFLYGADADATVDFAGFTEKRPDYETTGVVYTFGDDGSTYEDVDIYAQSKVVETIVTNTAGESVKVLNEYDKIEIEDKISTVDDKIENIYNTVMIDTGAESDGEEKATLQEVIINMNTAITKLEQINIEEISNSELEELFEENTTND